MIKHLNCVNGVNGDQPTDLSLKDIKDLMCVFIDEAASEEDKRKFGCIPIRCAIFCFCPNELLTELMHVSMYFPCGLQRVPFGHYREGEIGRLEAGRVFTSAHDQPKEKSFLGRDIYSMRLSWFLTTDPRAKEFLEDPYKARDINAVDLMATKDSDDKTSWLHSEV